MHFKGTAYDVKNFWTYCNCLHIYINSNKDIGFWNAFLFVLSFVFSFWHILTIIQSFSDILLLNHIWDIRGGINVIVQSKCWSHTLHHLIFVVKFHCVTALKLKFSLGLIMGLLGLLETKNGKRWLLPLYSFYSYS